MKSLRILIVDNDPSELTHILSELTQRFALRSVIFEHEIKLDAATAIETLRATSRFDLVFLDINGVDWRLFLREFGEIRPYLPVVMVSREAVPATMVECIDLGASSFLFKLDFTLDAVGRPSGQDEAKDRKKWNGALDKIQRLVREYRPIKRLLEAPLDIGRITKSGDRNSVIPDQIEFLKYVQELPAIRPHFPTLTKLPWTEGGMYFYEMPFYGLKPLRRIILEEMDQEVCEESAKRVLGDVLEFAFFKMYDQDKRDNIYSTYSDDTYFAKLAKRIAEAGAAAGALTARQNTALVQVYQNLLRADNVVIGTRNYRNPMAILDELRKTPEFITAVTPPYLCMIHGDMHFDNILVDDRLKRRETFKFVDPRGFCRSGYQPGVGDPAYDFGKLLHSAHGYYDLIHTGAFAVDFRSLRTIRGGVELADPALHRRDWDSTAQGGGGSGAKLTTHRRRVEPWVWSAFDSLYDFMVKWILTRKIQAADRSFLLRAYLNEALHFCTMGKFHLSIGDNDCIERAISLHVRGIQLMNDFATRWEYFRGGDSSASLGDGVGYADVMGMSREVVSK